MHACLNWWWYICKLQSWVVIKDILSSQMTEWITGISSLTYPWWVIRKLESTLTLANRVDLYVVVRWPKLVFSYPASPLFLRTQCPSNIQLRFSFRCAVTIHIVKLWNQWTPKFLEYPCIWYVPCWGPFYTNLTKKQWWGPNQLTLTHHWNFPKSSVVAKNGNFFKFVNHMKIWSTGETVISNSIWIWKWFLITV